MDLNDYILNHTDPEPSWLEKLDRDANVELMNPRMNSGNLQGRFLKMLAAISRARLALEIGTFGGYAAQCIAEGMTEDGKLITIEIDDEKEEFIRRHLTGSPVRDKIEIRIGNAIDIIPRLENEYGAESFDFIFLDADKRLYSTCYNPLLRLIRPGGILIADNVLWDGHVAEISRHDKMTEGIRQFNDMVALDNRVEKVLLPLRDGLFLIRKKLPL